MSSLYNVELELNYIGGILNHEDVFHETDFLKPADFSKQNGDIYSVISNIILGGQHPTPVVIADKCNAISIKFDGIDIKDYCDSLMLRSQSINKKGISSIAREIKKKSFVRTVCNNADKMKMEIKENQNDSINDLVKIPDKYLGESLISLSGEQKVATNFLDVLPDIIEEMGTKPDESPYINWPYETMNRIFGPLRPGQLYAFVARQGSNKSTLLLDIMREIQGYNINKPDLKILYLDTEMRVQDAAIRYVAGKIGVPYWVIDSHQWTQDSKWAPLIRKEMRAIRESKSKNLWFEPIGNISGKEMDKFIRRWYLNQCGRGNPCIIVYDYLKINTKDKGESESQKEYEVAYDKTEILKDLAEYCNAPLLTALQGNKAGDIFGKNGPDDSSGAASISDRIGWLVALMGILRRRMPEEIKQDSFPGMIAPTHKFIDLKQRYLGKDGPDYLNYVMYRDGKDIKYRKNYVNFNIENFRVEDKGTYSEWLDKGGKSKGEIKQEEVDSPL